jgi:hypothetical protein
MDHDRNRIITIIPATPGYMLIWSDESPVGDTPLDSMCDPIIAWQVQTDMVKLYVKGVLDREYTHSFSSPITLEGSHEETYRWGIRRPDGLYEIPGTATYRDYREFNTTLQGLQRD